MDGIGFTKQKLHKLLGGGFKYLLFSPVPGEMIESDSCFQMGWNHQVDKLHVTHAFCSVQTRYASSLVGRFNHQDGLQ